MRLSRDFVPNPSDWADLEKEDEEAAARLAAAKLLGQTIPEVWRDTTGATLPDGVSHSENASTFRIRRAICTAPVLHHSAASQPAPTILGSSDAPSSAAPQEPQETSTSRIVGGVQQLTLTAGTAEMMGSAPVGRGPQGAGGVDAASVSGAAASAGAGGEAEEDGEGDDEDEGEWAPVCSRSSRIRKQKKESRKAAAEARRTVEVRLCGALNSTLPRTHCRRMSQHFHGSS